jgi:hypothetical protein
VQLSFVKAHSARTILQSAAVEHSLFAFAKSLSARSSVEQSPAQAPSKSQTPFSHPGPARTAEPTVQPSPVEQGYPHKAPPQIEQSEEQFTQVCCPGSGLLSGQTTGQSDGGSPGI